MNADISLLLTIAGMAVVTAATRLGGYWIVAGMNPGPRFRRFLNAAPPAVFAAMIAPPLLSGGPAEWLGAGVTVVAMRKSGSLAIAIIAGIGATALLRLLFSA